MTSESYTPQRVIDLPDFIEHNLLEFIFAKWEADTTELASQATENDPEIQELIRDLTAVQQAFTGNAMYDIAQKIGVGEVLDALVAHAVDFKAEMRNKIWGAICSNYIPVFTDDDQKKEPDNN